VEFNLPDAATVQWHLLLDTAFDQRGHEAPADGATTTFLVHSRSIAVFNGIPA
jgi:hypothetical protein